MEDLIVTALFWFLLGGLLLGLGYASDYFLGLPLRRRERARLFLDLIEVGLKDGRRPEDTVRRAAESGDGRLGVGFHLLAAYLETGLSLDEALARVPRLLPATVVGMLRAGREAGDLRRVLPACRQLLQDPIGAVWAAQNYVCVATVVIGPFWIFLFTLMLTFVIPRFEQIAVDMEAPFPPLMQWLVAHRGLMVALQVVLVLTVYAGVFVYLAGPRLAAWINRFLPGTPDRAAWSLPWRRLRLQRDFSALLAILLDAGMPEGRALRLAGEGTANGILRSRAENAAARLAEGTPLPEAVRALDEQGEFRWRLANAAHGSTAFMAALRGWHEALTARAFQLEQTAAQLSTTGLVLLNGAFVALLVIGLFSTLIHLIEGCLLW